MTLKEAIEASRCRKGEAAGTTKHGAYWLASEPITIRRTGGDGIGNSGADVSFDLLLRHYRSGKVQASIHRDAYHQNGSYGGGGNSYESLPDSFLAARTVEEAIVALKLYRFGDDEAVYGDYHADTLTAALTGLGLVVAEPAPDEA